MKGSIVIEDSPLGGARFKIELPIVPPPAFPTTPGTVPTEK
jgi:signal transduction histidine kinase